MAIPNDRNSLVKWCLHKLGAPVIQINLDEQQIEDRVDEALEMFKEYHVDGTALFYKPFRITGSCLFLTADPVGEFKQHEMVIGGVSGAKGRFEYYDAGKKAIVFTYVDRVSPVQFQNGEIVTGEQSGTSGVLKPVSALAVGNMDLKYLELDDSVIGITEILKSRSTFGSHPINPFDLQYQLAQQVTIQTFLNADVVTYYIFQQDIQLWDQLFTGKQPYWHARKQNRLYLHANWTEEFKIGQYLVIQYWGTVEPEQFPKVYGDKWLRKYLTALLEVQWGQNLTKYTNIQLPGGVTLNGEQIQSRGLQAKEDAEVELRNTYEQKTAFTIG